MAYEGLRHLGKKCKWARVYTNCACAIVALGILLAQARPAMPCIHLVNEILNLHVEGFLVTVVVRLGQWLWKVYFGSTKILRKVSYKVSWLCKQALTPSLSDGSSYYEQDHSCNTSTKGPYCYFEVCRCSRLVECGCKMIELGLCIGFWLPYAISLK